MWLRGNKASKLAVFQSKERESPIDPNIDWATYQQRAALTDNIDYDCRFTNGLCKAYKDSTSPRKAMSCCGGCSYTTGYLEAIPPGTAHIFARLYNIKTGFWRAGKGCTLPRKYRSVTCLGYRCDSDKYDHKHETHNYWVRDKFDTYKFLRTGDVTLIQIALKEKA